MEKLTKRKERVLEALDSEIEELEEKLAKAQPLINELNQLRRTRATLLNERSSTGGGVRMSNGAPRLTMEEVIHQLRENGPTSVDDLAKQLGREPTVVRSHLNRHRGVRYERDDDGDWDLIGEEE